MTNDAPKRIWLQCGGDYHAAQEALKYSETGITWCVDQVDETETQYILSDHAQAKLQAAVVAERIACANMAYEYLTHSKHPMREELAEMIYKRTDTDALAALEAVKREARNEAAKAADKLGYHCIGCGHLCGDPEKDLWMLRKAGAKSCCPEREMEPLSAAILALMEDQSDE